MKKTTSISLLVSCVLIANLPVKAQLLFDDFDGASVNTGLWNPSSPFSQSQVSQSGGRLILVGRGGLDSVQSFPLSIQLNGNFRFTGTADHLAISLRSTGEFANSFAERYGIKVAFLQPDNTVHITQYQLDGSINVLAVEPYAYAPNTDYEFRITDDGTTISLFMMGSLTPTAQASSGYAPGNKISIYNRELASSQSEIGFINIVPEPQATVFVAMALSGLMFRRRR